MLKLDYSYNMKGTDGLALLKVHKYWFNSNSVIIEGLNVNQNDNTHIAIDSGKAYIIPNVSFIINEGAELVDIYEIISQPKIVQDNGGIIPDGHHLLVISYNDINRKLYFSLVPEISVDKWDNFPTRYWVLLGIVETSGGNIINVYEEYNNWKRIEFGLGGGSGTGGCQIGISDPVPVTHGGLESGTIIQGWSPCQVLETILFPYQYPSFTSFYIDGQTTQLEVGDSIIGGTRTFRWSTTNDQNIQPNSISIRDVTSSYDLIIGTTNDGIEDLDIGSNKTRTTPGSYTWQISGLNTKGGTFSRNFSVSWLYRKYWGYNPNDTLTETDVKNLQNSSLAASYNGTYNFTNPGSAVYYYVVYPDSWGMFNQWINTENGFGIDYADVGTVDVTNDYGVTITYRMIRTTYLMNGNLNSQMS